jgi:repressor LexA
MTKELTSRQKEVLKFIEKYQMDHGRSPTIKEIRIHFRLSSDNGVIKHIIALQKKGAIEKDKTPRGIRLLGSVKNRLKAASNIFSVPVLGFIPAGGPVNAEEHIEGYMTLGDELVRNSNDYFLLNVKGESMIDAGIFEGDMVLVNTSRQPKNGDIVVALVDHGNTLKRFIKEGNNIYLRAENKQYSDIHPEEELIIQGVVESLIRQYN